MINSFKVIPSFLSKSQSVIRSFHQHVSRNKHLAFRNKLGSTSYKGNPQLDPVYQEKVRKQVIILIEKLLALDQEDEDNLKISKLANSLEKHLYRTAPTWDFYADKSTLKIRLRLITCRIMKRRETRKQQGKPRLSVLKNLIGPEKIEEVAQLVNEVRSIRLARCAAACGQCQMSGTCSIKKQKSIPANKGVPRAVRRIFFETQLDQAFANTTPEDISAQDWDKLIQEAKHNIRGYKEWEGERIRRESIEIKRRASGILAERNSSKLAMLSVASREVGVKLL